jgi:hypothetical protein
MYKKNIKNTHKKYHFFYFNKNLLQDVHKDTTWHNAPQLAFSIHIPLINSEVKLHTPQNYEFA